MFIITYIFSNEIAEISLVHQIRNKIFICFHNDASNWRKHIHRQTRYRGRSPYKADHTHHYKTRMTISYHCQFSSKRATKKTNKKNVHHCQSECIFFCNKWKKACIKVVNIFVIVWFINYVCLKVVVVFLLYFIIDQNIIQINMEALFKKCFFELIIKTNMVQN